MNDSHPPSCRWVRRCAQICAGALVLALAGCSGSSISEADIATLVVTPDETITFADRCADEHDHMRTALVLFANPEARAHALALIAAGRVGGRKLAGRGEPGISMWLEKFHARGAPSGPDAHVHIALALGDVRGPGSPGLVRDAGGALVYDAYDEPRTTWRLQQALALGRSTLEARTRPARSRLLVYSARTEEAIALDGPVIDDAALAAAFALPPVESRTLSLPQTLNPAQKGGLWHTLYRGMRYDWCRVTHTASRNHFDELVHEGTFDADRWK